MGGSKERLYMASAQPSPAIVMMCGLQGSG